MRLMRYTVSDGCRMTEVDSKKPKWANYAEAEQQLGAMVEAVNGRLGNAVKEARFESKPVVTIGLLYADSGMVSGVFQNGALERELTNVTTRFGYRVDKLETNVGALSVGEQPVLTVIMSKVPAPADAKPKPKRASAKQRNVKKSGPKKSGPKKSRK